MSRAHIWRATTGGGLPVDYLRWLSAMWERYDGERSIDYFLEYLPPAEARRFARDDFDSWLVMICND